jgi:ComF family protein
MLSRYVYSCADLFFPKPCPGCGAHSQPESFICHSCRAALPVTGFINQPGNPVEKIFYGRVPVEAAAALFYFTKNGLLQHILFALKYRNQPEAGRLLGRMMGEAIDGSGRFAGVDLLMPLPLHPRKEKQRGYNQAAILCEAICAVTRIPVCSDILIRRQFTRTQTHQDRLHRWQNMEQVFALSNPSVLYNRRVLLIDDVITTGATLEASAVLLTGAGCRLSVLTAAYTQP